MTEFEKRRETYCRQRNLTEPTHIHKLTPKQLHRLIKKLNVYMKRNYGV